MDKHNDTQDQEEIENYHKSRKVIFKGENNGKDVLCHSWISCANF